MIELCFKLAELWKNEKIFSFIDTSVNNNNNQYSDFDTFNKSEKILFFLCV